MPRSTPSLQAPLKVVLGGDHRRGGIRVQWESRGETRGRAVGACLLLALSAFAAGCAWQRPPQVTRRIGGRETGGQFVPPYAYETYLRGELHLQRGEPAQAARELERALAAPELDPFVLSRLALALHLSGEVAEAEQRLAQAAELSPCLPELWLVRGRIAEREGDRHAALADYEHAVECDPGYHEARRAELELLAALGADERVRARQAEAEPAELPPQAREMALREALRAGRLETLRALLPPEAVVPPLPWLLRARALWRLGEIEAAARAFRHAAPLPDAALPDAAQALAAAGAWEEAGAAAEAALASELQTPVAEAMREIAAASQRADGHLYEATRRLPQASDPTLAEWLEQAGLPGLAQALRSNVRSEARAGAAQ